MYLSVTQPDIPFLMIKCYVDMEVLIDAPQNGIWPKHEVGDTV